MAGHTFSTCKLFIKDKDKITYYKIGKLFFHNYICRGWWINSFHVRVCLSIDSRLMTSESLRGFNCLHFMVLIQSVWACRLAIITVYETQKRGEEAVDKKVNSWGLSESGRYPTWMTASNPSRTVQKGLLTKEEEKKRKKKAPHIKPAALHKIDWLPRQLGKQQWMKWLKALSSSVFLSLFWWHSHYQCLRLFLIDTHYLCGWPVTCSLAKLKHQVVKWKWYHCKTVHNFHGCSCRCFIITAWMKSQYAGNVLDRKHLKSCESLLHLRLCFRVQLDWGRVSGRPAQRA